MTDIEVKPPKIEFPCADYPIKVIGDTGVGFRALVIEILEKHAEVDHKSLAERQSTNGKYTTIQLHIIATGQDQLYDINSELRATGQVHMVL
jgi:putative lipoic acid-binding regulatory protein